MMMMDGGGGGAVQLEAFFPVLFFDGERTMDMGFVAINPGMNFKGFQLIISQKIGISPHQITTYIERTPPPPPQPQPLLFPSRTGTGRRFPVTSKFNFAAAMAERNSAYFLVVSKKSRRVRRRRHRQQRQLQQQQQTSIYGGTGGVNNAPERFLLLRRDSNYPDISNPATSYFDHQSSPQHITGTVMMEENWYHHPLADSMEYSSNIMSVVGRGHGHDKYLMSLDLNSDVYSEVNNVLSWLDKSISESSEMATSDDGVSSWGGVSSSTGAASQQSFCEVCAAAAAAAGMMMDGVPFHCCKFDAVVSESFRSSAGPIARPSLIRYSG